MSRIKKAGRSGREYAGALKSLFGNNKKQKN
jgi:hypothetical protein